MNGKAVKKPIEIDFLNYNANVEEVKEWVKTFGDNFDDHFIYKEDALRVKTKEGHSYIVETGDVIIRGIAGEYYPCQLRIFVDSYDITKILGSGCTHLSAQSIEK